MDLPAHATVCGTATPTLWGASQQTHFGPCPDDPGPIHRCQVGMTSMRIDTIDSSPYAERKNLKSIRTDARNDQGARRPLHPGTAPAP
jgi:hypothetical protein